MNLRLRGDVAVAAGGGVAAAEVGRGVEGHTVGRQAQVDGLERRVVIGVASLDGDVGADEELRGGIASYTALQRGAVQVVGSRVRG